MRTSCGNHRRALALLVAAVNLFLSGCLPAISASNSKAAPPKRLDGAVSKDQLADALSSDGLQLVLQEGPKPRLNVYTVKLGSPAYYQGMQANDNIVRITAADALLKIDFLRDGRKYQVQLPLQPEFALNGSYDLRNGVHRSLLNGKASDTGVPLKRLNANRDSTKINVVDINGPVIPVADVGMQKRPIVDVPGKAPTRAGIERLAQYNVELIIDRTGSMQWVDGTDGMSKFEWCHNQVRDLVKRLSPYQNCVTITTFNTSFDTRENCTLEEVERIYGSIKPEGNTDLVDPLVQRLDAAYAIWHSGKKRTLIVVIHDGLPNVPHDTTVVDKEIIDYTKRMRDPKEVLVTFLQIGDTYDGKDFCQRLDTELISKGAKYDIVDSVTFDRLKSEGLTNALIQAVTNNVK
ncbi:MAG TPA: hypothetical protein V6C97_17290 [Oculatellaceae cyanobacterium]